MKRTTRLIALCLLTLCACSQKQAKPALNVFAAASLTDAFSEIARSFEAEYSVKVVVNFAGSSTLATQITEGGPADVFASASPEQMRRINDSNRIFGTPVIFAHNRLILVVPETNPAEIHRLSDLAKQNVKIVLAATGVPVREYVDIIIDQLAADETYGADFRDKFYDNVVSEEDNVRQTLAKVILGEADAAFVYASDVRQTETRVITLEIPAELQPSVEYPIAVLGRTNNRESAEAFLNFVLDQTGQCILKQYGLTPVTDDC